MAFALLCGDVVSFISFWKKDEDVSFRKMKGVWILKKMDCRVRIYESSVPQCEARRWSLGMYKGTHGQ